MKGFEELLRVTKPGGSILIFIYSKSYKARRNLNQFSKHLNQESSHDLRLLYRIISIHGGRWMSFTQIICQKISL